jgi:hypothetical protein
LKEYQQPACYYQITADPDLTLDVAALTARRPPPSPLPLLCPEPRPVAPRRTGVPHLAPSRASSSATFAAAAGASSGKAHAAVAALLGHRPARGGDGPRQPAQEAVLRGSAARDCSDGGARGGDDGVCGL